MAIETWKPLETDGEGWRRMEKDGEGWRRMEEVGSAGRREGKGEMSKDENDSRNGIKRNTKERQRNVKYEINSRVAKHGNSPRIEPQFLIPAGWDIGIRRTKLTQMSTPSSGQFWRRLTRRPCPYERAALFGDGANYKSKILAQYIQIGARKNKDPLFSSSFSTFFCSFSFSTALGLVKENKISFKSKADQIRFVSLAQQPKRIQIVETGEKKITTKSIQFDKIGVVIMMTIIITILTTVMMMTMWWWKAGTKSEDE